MAVVGFSTGAIALDDFTTALQLLAPTRAKAVELSALRAAELPALLAALPNMIAELRNRYEYVSFHAPTNFDRDTDLVAELKIVADMGLNIVAHPDTIHDTSVWRSLGARLCIENMDSRKPAGRTADELQYYFDRLPEARLCFDVAHARQVDASMTEAFRILERFGDRLAEVHISEVNSRGRHFAMSFAAKRAYEPFAARLAAIPVIIESMVKRDEIVHEISETEKVLSFNRHSHAKYQYLSGAHHGSVHSPER